MPRSLPPARISMRSSAAADTWARHVSERERAREWVDLYMSLFHSASSRFRPSASINFLPWVCVLLAPLACLPAMSSRGGGVGGRRGGPGGASSVRGGERGRKRGRGALDAVEPRVPLPRGTGSGPGAGRDGAAAPVPALQPAEADVLSGEVETEMAAGMEAREGASSSSSASAPAVGEVEPPSRAVGALPPTSSKAVVLQARPGFGTVGTSCRVRANHFVVQLADKEIYHYDVLHPGFALYFSNFFY